MISSCYLILILVFRCLPLLKLVNPCFGQFFGLFERPKSSKTRAISRLPVFVFRSSLTSLTPRSRRHVPRLLRPTIKGPVGSRIVTPCQPRPRPCLPITAAATSSKATHCVDLAHVRLPVWFALFVFLATLWLQPSRHTMVTSTTRITVAAFKV